MSLTMALKARKSDKHWAYTLAFMKDEHLLGLVDSIDRISILDLLIRVV